MCVLDVEGLARGLLLLHTSYRLCRTNTISHCLLLLIANRRRDGDDENCDGGDATKHTSQRHSNDWVLVEFALLRQFDAMREMNNSEDERKKPTEAKRTNMEFSLNRTTNAPQVECAQHHRMDDRTVNPSGRMYFIHCHHLNIYALRIGGARPR